MLNSIVIIKKTLNSSIQHTSPNMSSTVHNIKLKNLKMILPCYQHSKATKQNKTYQK